MSKSDLLWNMLPARLEAAFMKLNNNYKNIVLLLPKIPPAFANADVIDCCRGAPKLLYNQSRQS